MLKRLPLALMTAMLVIGLLIELFEFGKIQWISKIPIMLLPFFALLISKNVTMLLFVELFALISFLLCVAHAIYFRRSLGAIYFVSTFYMGFVRENFVLIRQILYGFIRLTLILGKAPLIATIVWAYSIYVSISWAEEVGGEKFSEKNSWKFIALVCLFMIALAFFYEPFLKLIGMARWETGTRVFLDTPLIALVGYPTMTLLYLCLWRWIMTRYIRTASRLIVFLILIPPVAIFHALALQAMKTFLRW